MGLPHLLPARGTLAQLACGLGRSLSAEISRQCDAGLRLPAGSELPSACSSDWPAAEGRGGTPGGVPFVRRLRNVFMCPQCPEVCSPIRSPEHRPSPAHPSLSTNHLKPGVKTKLNCSLVVLWLTGQGLVVLARVHALWSDGSRAGPSEDSAKERDPAP